MDAAAGGGAAARHLPLFLSQKLLQVPQSNFPDGFGEFYTREMMMTQELGFRNCWSTLYKSKLTVGDATKGDVNNGNRWFTNYV